MSDEKPADSRLERAGSRIQGCGMQILASFVGILLRIGGLVIEDIHTRYPSSQFRERCGIGAIGIGTGFPGTLPRAHHFLYTVAVAGHSVMQRECEDMDVAVFINQLRLLRGDGLEFDGVAVVGSESGFVEIQHRLQTFRSHYGKRFRTVIERHGAEQAVEPENMVSMDVGDEDGLNLYEGKMLLADTLLGPFPAVQKVQAPAH